MCRNVLRLAIARARRSDARNYRGLSFRCCGSDAAAGRIGSDQEKSPGTRNGTWGTRLTTCPKQGIANSGQLTCETTAISVKVASDASTTSFGATKVLRMSDSVGLGCWNVFERAAAKPRWPHETSAHAASFVRRIAVGVQAAVAPIQRLVVSSNTLSLILLRS
jgi:hypothetical protein